MKIKKKKQLAAKVLGIGMNRVVFEPSRFGDIREAITRQDIRDLVADKAIKIRPIIGRHKKERRKRKRGTGKVKMKVRTRKRDYITRIRMLRREFSKLREQGKITEEEYKKLRQLAKMSFIKDRKHLYEYLKSKKL